VRRSAVQVVVVGALAVGLLVYVIANGIDVAIGWNEVVGAVVATLFAVLGACARRRAERERRERDELVNAMLGREPYVLPPLAERDECYAPVKIAERPVEHAHVPWYRTWRTLILVPLPAGILGAALQGSGWWLVLAFVGLILAVAHLFTRAVENELDRPEGGTPRERLS
jgi:membrane protein implicated in regulation of membrane protease activity